MRSENSLMLEISILAFLYFPGNRIILRMVMMKDRGDP
jgi:hypothetical protein